MIALWGRVEAEAMAVIGEPGSETMYLESSTHGTKKVEDVAIHKSSWSSRDSPPRI